MLRAYFRQCCFNDRTPGAGHQQEKTQHRQRQRRINLQLLRHVADTQARTPPDLAAAGLQQAEHDTHQAGLARTVGANQGHDLAALDAEIDAFEHIGGVQAQTDLLE